MTEVSQPGILEKLFKSRVKEKEVDEEEEERARKDEREGSVIQNLYQGVSNILPKGTICNKSRDETWRRAKWIHTWS